MIPENVSPALFGRVPPASKDDAACRMGELISVDGSFAERLVGSVWHDLAQLEAALKECSFFVSPVKKPIKNAHSITTWRHLVSAMDGSEYEILVNEMGHATIINAWLVSGPKS